MNFREIARNGIWKQNTSLVQLLGLCPLLAVSTSFVNGVSLAVATILVMAMASGVVASVRSFIPHEIRIPVFILIIAALVTMVDLAMNAWLHELYLVLGIFIPLIVVNCIVLARVEAFAAKNTPLTAAWDGAMMGVGMAVAIAMLGGLRELIGTGLLFSGIEMVIPGAQCPAAAAGGLSGLPRRHPAARRLPRPRLPHRRAQLAGRSRCRARPPGRARTRRCMSKHGAAQRRPTVTSSPGEEVGRKAS
ncbi:hypothetical protein MASR1M97_07340 [Candidatus Desulfobacillus denitrificans]